MGIRFIATCLVGALLAAAPAQAALVDWSTTGATSATGTLGATTVNLSDLGPVLAGPSIVSVDLSGSDFSFAPGSTSEEAIGYGALADWSATFSPPVSDLLLYAVSWRGAFAGTDPVTYTFDQPFSIKSGLTSASVSGTTLTLPGHNTAGFQSGILQFAAPISSLNMTTNATGHSRQSLTFGLPMDAVPEPPAWLMLSVLAAGAAAVRRRMQTTNPPMVANMR